jgi:UDP-N-acetylmuramyl pentapeptide synthase
MFANFTANQSSERIQMKYSVAQLAEILEAIVDGNHTFADNIITEIVIDSRKIKDGEQNVFWALKGEKNDGHKYIPDALALE